MTTWHSEVPPSDPPIGVMGYVRAGVRIAYLVPLIFGGLTLLSTMRLVERPIWRDHRPWTPSITRFVCRAALWIIGIKHQIHGRVAAGQVAMVANHVSWLDIFALNACDRVYFVSKAEVAGWPGIGLLARATGTVFITRIRRDARAQSALLEERLSMRHRLLFFPEGTSTDGQRVLPFKTTLFAPFFTSGMSQSRVQPVTLRYRAPADADPRFYGWWGGMEFGGHLIKILSARRHGRVDVIFHPAIPLAACRDRKELARLAEERVRAGLEGGLEGGEPLHGIGGAPDFFPDRDEIR